MKTQLCPFCGGFGVLHSLQPPAPCQRCRGTGRLVIYPSGAFAPGPGRPFSGSIRNNHTLSDVLRPVKKEQ